MAEIIPAPFPWVNPDGTEDLGKKAEWYREHAEKHYAQFQRATKGEKIWRNAAFEMARAESLFIAKGVLDDALAAERELYGQNRDS